MPIAPSFARASIVLAGALAACAFASSASAAGAEDYALDPVHTRVMFAVDHAGFSKAIGTVSGSTGTLTFDPDDWRAAKLRARVPLANADLGDATWNKAVRARALLDAEDHPYAEFVSTRVEPAGPDRAVVHGTLLLHGVSREVALDVTLNALKRHPLPPFRRTLGFSATATLSRKAFGIDAWPGVIGDAIELRIEAEATRARGAGDDDDAPPAASSPQPADTPADTPAEDPAP